MSCESDIAFLNVCKCEFIVTVCGLNFYYGVLTFGFGRSEKYACGPSNVVLCEIAEIGDDGAGVSLDSGVEGNVLDHGSACGNFNDRIDIVKVYGFFGAYFFVLVAAFGLKACAKLGKADPFPGNLVPALTVGAHKEGYGNELCVYSCAEVYNGFDLVRGGKVNFAFHSPSDLVESNAVLGGTYDKSVILRKTDHCVAVYVPVDVNGIDALNGIKLENDGAFGRLFGIAVGVLNEKDAVLVKIACGSVNIRKNGAVIQLSGIVCCEGLDVITLEFYAYNVGFRGNGNQEKGRNKSYCDNCA